MAYGFDEPHIHNVARVTAKFSAGQGFTCVDLTFVNGRGEETAASIFFRADAAAYAHALAAAINAVEVPETEAQEYQRKELEYLRNEEVA